MTWSTLAGRWLCVGLAACEACSLLAGVHPARASETHFDAHGESFYSAPLGSGGEVMVTGASVGPVDRSLMVSDGLYWLRV